MGVQFTAQNSPDLQECFVIHSIVPGVLLDVGGVVHVLNNLEKKNGIDGNMWHWCLGTQEKITHLDVLIAQGENDVRELVFPDLFGSQPVHQFRRRPIPLGLRALHRVEPQSQKKKKERGASGKEKR